MIDMDDESHKALSDEIERVSNYDVYLETKAEIVDYYQDKYQKGWKQQLSKDLGAFLNKKSKNIERRFDPSRLNSPEKRNTQQYKDFGKTLPPKDRLPRDLRGKRARVKVNGNVKISGDDRNKTIDRVLTPDQLQRLLEGDMTPVIEAYGNINPADVEEITNLQIDIELLD